MIEDLRSLSYLCHSFDQLYQGENTPLQNLPSMLAFNFQPFPDYPQFHATYKLINTENGMVYSDKFLLNVIDLTQINLSTDADKKYQLDVWTKFFTAKTWEEVIMLAENNPYIDEAAQTLYEANADEITKMQCRARRDYYKLQNTRDRNWREAMAENAELKATLAEKDNALAEKDALIEELRAQLAKQTK